MAKQPHEPDDTRPAPPHSPPPHPPGQPPQRPGPQPAPAPPGQPVPTQPKPDAPETEQSGALDAKTKEALGKIGAHKGEQPLAEGSGTYVVTFDGEPARAVEAKSPEEAKQAAADALGVRKWEREPAVVKVP